MRATGKMAVIALLAMIMAAAGCDNIKRVGYSHYASVDSKCWTRDMVCAFDVDSGCDSLMFSPGYHDVVVSVRHNAQYPYSTLRLAVETASLADDTRRDTISIKLAGDDGTWLGRKTGALYVVNDTLLRNVWIDRSWEVSLAHAASADTLVGINDLGIILLKR